MKERIKHQKIAGLLGLLICFIIAILCFAADNMLGIGAGTAISTALIGGVWIKGGKFTELTPDELKSMSEDEIIKYNKDLRETQQEAFKAMLEDKMDKKTFDEAVKNLATIKDIGELKASFEVIVNTIKNLKVVPASKVNQQKTLLEQLEENKSYFDNWEKGKKLKISLPQRDLATKANTLTTSITDSIYGMRLAGVGQLNEYRFTFTDRWTAAPVDPNSEDRIQYVDWDNDTVARAAAFKAEGVTFVESTAKWIGKSMELQSVGVVLPVSDKMLRSLPLMTAEIETFMMNDVKRAENTELYSGDGTAPDIKGLYTYATAFNHAGYTGDKFTKANIADLILVIKTLMNGYGDGKYMPNVVYMTYADYMAFGGEKTTDGMYIQLPTHGMTIIPSNFVTTNTMIVADESMIRYYASSDYIIEQGWVNAQFNESMKSLKITRTCGLLVRDADVKGVIKVTDVEAAIDAITAVA